MTSEDLQLRSTLTQLPSGVRGLDEILRGGIPARRLILLQGAPGSGKTTLGLQFLLEGMRRGETCLYVSLSESDEEIAGVASSHGWNLQGIHICDLSLIERQFRDDEANTIFPPDEVELGETTQPVLDLISQIKPARVVFDSLSELRMLASHPLRYRRKILSIKQHLAKHGCTTLFLDDGSSNPSADLQLQSLAHGVIELKQRAPLYGKARRQLCILKLRGVDAIGGYHDLNIEKGGAVIFPRLVAATHALTSAEAATSRLRPERVKSGLTTLDALLGGGPIAGTSTLIAGQAGAGKSLLMSQFAWGAAERGERVAVFLFEESVSSFLSRSAALGIAMEKHIASGTMSIQSIDPAELSPSEFAHIVRNAVEHTDARVIAIDTLNGYFHAMPEEKFLVLQLHELLTYLSLRGVSTFLVLVQHGMLGQATTAVPVDVSYLVDNVLLLRFFELSGRVRKALSVIKMRASEHESSIRELQIANGHVTLGPPLDKFQGVLTGTPVHVGAAPNTGGFG